MEPAERSLNEEDQCLLYSNLAVRTHNDVLCSVFSALWHGVFAEVILMVLWLEEKEIFKRGRVLV